jgi:hypothetical protein
MLGLNPGTVKGSFSYLSFQADSRAGPAASVLISLGVRLPGYEADHLRLVPKSILCGPALLPSLSKAKLDFYVVTQSNTH